MGIRRLSRPIPEHASAAPKELGSEIHVWTASATATDPEGWLTPHECARRDRLRQPADRSRFTAGRALGRRVLAHYLGCSARCVAFEFDEHGKPRLADGRPPCFNLTHAGDCVACAVADEACGIDVEFVHPLPRPEAIARRILDDDAHARWRMLDRTESLDLLFAHWTLYEALCKADGRGVAHGGEYVQLVDAASTTGWHGCRWRPAPDYWLAVVAGASGRFARVRWFSGIDLDEC